MLSTGNKAEIMVARDIFFVDGGATPSETLESFDTGDKRRLHSFNDSESTQKNA